jgi:hypothetical protein
MIKIDIEKTNKAALESHGTQDASSRPRLRVYLATKLSNPALLNQETAPLFLCQNLKKGPYILLSHNVCSWRWVRKGSNNKFVQMFKTKHLLFVLTAIHIGIQTAPVGAQNGSEVRPLSKELLRWHRYPYRIDSSYPYLKALPDWSKIPVLFEWMKREDSDAGIEVARSQLVALSRADFNCSLYPSLGGAEKQSEEYYKSVQADAWAHWWKSVGRSYNEQLRTRGRENVEAWKLVTRDKNQPVPGYKVVIPEVWTLRTSYSAGDYDYCQTEALTLRRSKEKATLIRCLRKSTRGPLEWERWEQLTTEQADNFAFAMAYGIDNPWLLKAGSETDTQPRTDLSQAPWEKKLEVRNLNI